MVFRHPTTNKNFIVDDTVQMTMSYKKTKHSKFSLLLGTMAKIVFWSNCPSRIIICPLQLVSTI